MMTGISMTPDDIRAIAGHGNNSCAMGYGYAFVQHRVADEVWVSWLEIGISSTWTRYQMMEGRGTGLSRVVYDHHPHPIRVDDDRTSQPGMTLPSYSGALVAGEHPESGIIVRRTS